MKPLATCVAVTCFLCPASEQVEAASARGFESASAQALAGGQVAQAIGSPRQLHRADVELGQRLRPQAIQRGTASRVMKAEQADLRVGTR